MSEHQEWRCDYGGCDAATETKEEFHTLRHSVTKHVDTETHWCPDHFSLAIIDWADQLRDEGDKDGGDES